MLNYQRVILVSLWILILRIRCGFVIVWTWYNGCVTRKIFHQIPMARHGRGHFRWDLAAWTFPRERGHWSKCKGLVMDISWDLIGFWKNPQLFIDVYWRFQHAEGVLWDGVFIMLNRRSGKWIDWIDYLCLLIGGTMGIGWDYGISARTFHPKGPKGPKRVWRVAAHPTPWPCWTPRRERTSSWSWAWQLRGCAAASFDGDFRGKIRISDVGPSG